MTMNGRDFWILLLLTAPWATPTAAQLPQRSQDRLIEVLADHGMGELIDRLAQTYPAEDPVVVVLLDIARLQARSSDPRLEPNDRVAASKQMVDAMRKLIKDRHEHEQRPLWQTNLAQRLLFTELRIAKEYAAEFYEFGVPRDDQRRAFESTVVEALELLADAELGFFHLETHLPHEPDHEAKRVATGLWDRMIQEYYKHKTPFLLAHAAYYTALLGDDHPYYKNLDNRLIPRQRKTAPEERRRLLALCTEKLSGFATKPDDRYGIRLASISLMGRARARQAGGLDEGIEMSDKAISLDGRGFYGLLSQLAKAAALDRKGEVGPARKLLSSASGHSLARQDLLLRLLVTDEAHRLMLDKAQGQPDAVKEAYALYDELLAQPALGDSAEALKNYIYTRWEAMIDAGADISTVPDSVVVAAGEMARRSGQSLVNQAQQIDPDGEDPQAAALLEQSKPKLQRAIAITTALLENEGLEPPHRAGAMFNLGWATYFLAQSDPDGQIAAAKIWTELAQQLPDQPLAEEAVSIAIKVLRPYYSLEPKPEGVAETYEQTASVLIEQFPTSEAADDERVYYAFYLLIPQGKYDEVVKVLNEMPRDHPLYFEAQSVLLTSLQQMFKQAEKVADKNYAQRRLGEAAHRVIDEARNLDIDPGAQGDQLASDARKAHGWARLMLADIAIAQGKTDEAIAQLEGFETDFNLEADLVRLALNKGIVAQAQSGKLGLLVERAKKMMDLFPNDAAAVIDGVLTDLNQSIDELRRRARSSQVDREKKEMETQAASFAQAAQMLSELLLDWAVRQKFNDEELVPYKLILARAMRLAGNTDGALDILDPLMAQAPDDTDMIHNMAETLFAKGDEPSLVKAAEQYDRLINGLQPPYPPRWWNAWLRRLQVMDRLNQAVSDIPLRVRALEFTDPNLGGEPYRTDLKRLSLKHQ